MPFDKFGMLIKAEEPKEPEEEEVWVTRYYFCMDDGAHADRLHEFTDLEEAKYCYYENEKQAMADPEKYFVDMGCVTSKEDWTQHFYPEISLEEWKVLMKDGEEEGIESTEHEEMEFVEGIDSWDPVTWTELEEDESAKKEK